jgi:hypothetical protein
MEEIVTSAGPTDDTSSKIASVAVIAATVALVGWSYYAVRRGLDRKIERKIEKHLSKEK